MSDLQIGLLAIGVAVVAGVLAYNRMQEARTGAGRAGIPLGPCRRAASERHDGAETAAPARVPAVEPPRSIARSSTRSSSMPPAPQREAAAPLAAAGPDPAVDYIVELDCARPVSGADLPGTPRHSWRKDWSGRCTGRATTSRGRCGARSPPTASPAAARRPAAGQPRRRGRRGRPGRVLRRRAEVALAIAAQADSRHRRGARPSARARPLLRRGGHPDRSQRHRQRVARRSRAPRSARSPRARG